MKIVLVIAVVAMIIFMSFVSIQAIRSKDRDIFDIAPTVALTLTLIAVAIYAYDTHSIASIMKEQLRHDNVYNVTYSMRILDREIPEAKKGRTMFAIHNQTSLVIRAKVFCNLKIYGQPADCKGAFDGREVWYAFPQQISQGWFDIDDVLEKYGTSIDKMISESSEGNRDTQFTMDLEMTFRDELENIRQLPARRHYFVFKDWLWIPVITKEDDWD